jgi:hypothetical protein
MIRCWLVLPLFAVALAACGRGGSATAIETALGAPVQLAPGQAVVIENANLEVRFAGIASDSRCPSDVTCLWAGEVVVQLAVRSDGRTTQHEIREMHSATIGGYTVAVLQVLPARTSSQPIAPADYRATLKITR